MPDAAKTVQHLSRMIQQHLDSFRAAGIEWLELAESELSRFTEERGNLQLPVPSFTVSPAAASDLFAQAPQPLPERSPDEKRLALLVLDREVQACTRCSALVQNRTQTVFGVGNPSAELCFVGEAPGVEEDRQGEPFVGPAGQLLNAIITKGLKMRREDVYICNVLKCRPPNNRTPLPDEVANCRHFLEQQLAVIRPKYLCALGAPAAQWLTGTTLSIGRLRGRFYEYHGIPVLCTYHPAYLLRNPAAKRDVWDDLKKLLARMGRPVE
jgi:DNA polymerase